MLRQWGDALRKTRLAGMEQPPGGTGRQKNRETVTQVTKAETWEQGDVSDTGHTGSGEGKEMQSKGELKMALRTSAAGCTAMRFSEMWEEQLAWEKKKTFLLTYP